MFFPSLDLKQRDMVKICAILCGITYVAAILATFTHCTPLHRKWQVYPYPGGMKPARRRNDKIGRT